LRSPTLLTLSRTEFRWVRAEQFRLDVDAEGMRLKDVGLPVVLATRAEDITDICP
jgi:hypothetical protein